METIKMKKKLKIKFWKVESAFAMQVLEQIGLPEQKDTGKIRIACGPDIEGDIMYLRGDFNECNYDVICQNFDTNQDRDSYLDKITQAITDELFTGTGELKIGEMCEISSCPGDGNGYWHEKKLIAILPDNYYDRFIVQSDEDSNDWFCYKYARPLCKRIEPKVETNREVITYTWEEE